MEIDTLPYKNMHMENMSTVLPQIPLVFQLETAAFVIKKRMDTHQGLQNARTFISEKPNSLTAQRGNL